MPAALASDASMCWLVLNHDLHVRALHSTWSALCMPVLLTDCWHLQPINAEGKNVVPEVWEVLDKIKDFSDKVRAAGQAVSSLHTCISPVNVLTGVLCNRVVLCSSVSNVAWDT